MEYELSNNQLKGPNIDYQKSPNQGGRFNLNQLDTIIIHYTAGSSRLSSVRTLLNPSRKASAHLVVGRDEKITQLVDFDKVAWHAGQSSHLDRVGLNKYSIGIEIDNAGVLDKSQDSYISWFGKTYDDSDVVAGIHRNENNLRYWHKFTEWQIENVLEICELLIQKYNIKYILGHEEISPRRKIDPGPAFPLDKVRERLFNSDRSIDEKEDVIAFKEGKVTASALNIRMSPDGESEAVGLPLPKGAIVEILEEKDGWYKVQTSLEGWVYGKYIKQN